MSTFLRYLRWLIRLPFVLILAILVLGWWASMVLTYPFDWAFGLTDWPRWGPFSKAELRKIIWELYTPWGDEI
jgi:hypothetical protein